MSGSKIGFSFQTVNKFDQKQEQTAQTKTALHQTAPQQGEYIVKRGDTLTEIAVRTGQNLQQLLQRNQQIRNPNKIQIGQHINIGKPSNVYTVKSGDTLSKIAETKHTSVGDIMRANPGQIGNRNLIYPGQKLIIPLTAKEPSVNKPTRQPQQQQPKFEQKTPQTSGQNQRVETKPNNTQATTVSGTRETGSTETPSNGGSLSLGVNEKYKDDLLFAQKVTGTNASSLAGLINAEAAKDGKGVWQADSYNQKTHAGGLTQFLPNTWREMATTRGTYLNQIAVQKGFVREVGGKFQIADDAQLLNLRFNSRNAIVSAAEYDKKTLGLAERSGFVPANLSSDERAKYLYYAHHEGPGGVLTHLVDSRTATEEQAKSILKIRLGGDAKAQAYAKQFGLFRSAYAAFAEQKARTNFPQQFGTDKSVMNKYVAQHGGSYEQGYRAWLSDYTASKVKPQNFRTAGGDSTRQQRTTPSTENRTNSTTQTRSGSVGQTKMPATQNLSESQKYDVYTDFISRNGNAKAKNDLANGQRVILGLRQQTNTRENNGMGAYDDRVVVMWKDKDGGKHVHEVLNANTEPASYYEDTAANRANPKRRGKITTTDANGDGRGDLGRLTEGTHEYSKSFANHFGVNQEAGYNILRPTSANAIERDSNHDGNFSRQDASQNKRNLTDSATMYFHRGGRGAFTGSAGCQTMSQADFNQFWKSLGSQKTFQYVLVNVD